MNTTIEKIKKLKGEIKVPGDKSIAHRAVILNAIANGRAVIENFPMGQDCLSTVEALNSMGAKIRMNSATESITIEGVGLNGLSEPATEIDAENSGTTARL